jgi:hypothetical protein
MWANISLFPTLTSELANIASLTSGATGSSYSNWFKVSHSSSTYTGVSFPYVVNISGGSPILTGTVTGTSVYYSGSAYSQVDNRVIATLRSQGAYYGAEQLTYIASGVTFDLSASTAALTNPYAQFTITGTSIVSGAFSYPVTFDNTSTHYITNMLGTVPFEKTAPIFVEEMFPAMLSDYYAAGMVAGLKVQQLTDMISFSANQFDNYQANAPAYQPAVTPFFVSEVRANKVFRLFRLWTISDGDAANSQFKVSITNIQPDLGTFDILIRNYNDTDARPVVLEQWAGLTMDPTQTSYIGRQIGTTDGNYSSNSTYVLVEMADEASVTTAVPCGFVGFPVKNYLLNDETNTGILAPAAIYNQTYTPYTNNRKVFLGISDTTGYDENLFNYIGAPAPHSVPNIWTGLTHGFHMDVTASAVTIDGITVVIDTSGHTYSPTFLFDTGNQRFQSELQIAQDAASGLTSYQQLYSRKFTTVPYGGFDGWDVYRTQRTNTDQYKIGGTLGVLGTTTGNFVSYPLANGDNGITSDYYAYHEAAYTFDNPEETAINVLATPGIDTINNDDLVSDIIEIVEIDRADCCYIIDTPDVIDGAVLTSADVVEELNNVSAGNDSNYSATYFPWIQVNDTENNVYIWLPPTRDVVRNIAYTDNVAYPWFATAGLDRGNVDCIKARINLKQSDRDTLYGGRINPLETFSTEGVKIWGNKTLQVADSALNRLNIRRLLLQARKLISVACLQLVFGQDDSTQATKFTSLVNPILTGIQTARGLTDFRVTVQQSAEDLDNNMLEGTIWIKPTVALEYVKIGFNLTSQGASFDSI